MLNENQVIMVDDNSDEICLAKLCFERSALKNAFLSFTDAREFLAYMASVKAGEVAMPALVLLDINMPVMSGFEVLQALRGDPCFGPLPVMIITNSSDQRDVDKSYALGANCLKLKPQSIKEYVSMFDSLRAGLM